MQSTVISDLIYVNLFDLVTSFEASCDQMMSFCDRILADVTFSRIPVFVSPWVVAISLLTHSVLVAVDVSVIYWLLQQSLINLYSILYA